MAGQTTQNDGLPHGFRISRAHIPPACGARTSARALNTGIPALSRNWYGPRRGGPTPAADDRGPPAADNNGATSDRFPAALLRAGLLPGREFSLPPRRGSVPPPATD